MISLLQPQKQNYWFFPFLLNKKVQGSKACSTGLETNSVIFLNTENTEDVLFKSTFLFVIMLNTIQSKLCVRFSVGWLNIIQQSTDLLQSLIKGKLGTKLNTFSELTARVHFSFLDVFIQFQCWDQMRLLWADPTTLMSKSCYLSSVLSPQAKPY